MVYVKGFIRVWVASLEDLADNPGLLFLNRHSENHLCHSLRVLAVLPQQRLNRGHAEKLGLRNTEGRHMPTVPVNNYFHALSHADVLLVVVVASHLTASEFPIIMSVYKALFNGAEKISLYTDTMIAIA